MDKVYSIDEPSPLASPEELEEFLRDMAKLDQDNSQVQLAIKMAKSYLAMQTAADEN